MKKIIAMGAALLAASFVFAYNPPIGGENIFKLSNPTSLGGNASASGGPFKEVVPGSIFYNPAITSDEQRTVLNLSASILIDTDKSDGSSDLGWGFQTGVIVPSKYLVFTAAAQGMFVNNPGLDLGKEVSAHLGVAKDITENLSVGINGYFGYFFGDEGDFIAGADIGVLYKFDRLGFMKDARLGVSVLNMGKPLSDKYKVKGLYGTDGTSYPSIFTPRLSFAAEVFSLGNFKNNFKGAFSVDGYFPTFQNAVCDLAFGVSYNDFANLTIGWEANVREIAETKKVTWPSVGLNLHFVISSGSKKSDMEENEFIPSIAWQNLYGGIQDISVGTTMYFGMTDNEAPKIILWDDEE